MGFIDIRVLKSALNATGDEHYVLECAEHGNNTVEMAVSAVTDVATLDPKSDTWRRIANVAKDFAIAYHYERQGWPDKERALREAADKGLDRVIERLKAENPKYSGVTIVTRDPPQGHTLFDASSNVALGL